MLSTGVKGISLISPLHEKYDLLKAIWNVHLELILSKPNILGHLTFAFLYANLGTVEINQRSFYIKLSLNCFLFLLANMCDCIKVCINLGNVTSHDFCSEERQSLCIYWKLKSLS